MLANKGMHLTKGARSGRFAADRLEAPFAGDARCCPGRRVRLLTAVLLSAATAAVAQPATPTTFLALVAQKVETRQVPYQPGDFNLEFVAKYRVLDRLFGEYAESDIEFLVFDHYGQPALFDFATALIYVSRSEGRWVLEKYQFHDVYRTAEGRWASCGDPYKFESEPNRGPRKAVPLQFSPDLTFPVSGLSTKEIREKYPPAYFEHRGAMVVCRKGAYAEELFAVKREGVLKARGLFK